MQLIFYFGVAAHAQDTAKVDSLLYLIETTKDDSVKVYLNVAIAKEYARKDVIRSLNYGEKALEIAEKSDNISLISYALFNLGASYFQRGVMELSIPYFFRYLEINTKLNDEKAIAYAMVNIGSIYLEIEQLDRAAEYFEKALQKFERIYADADSPGKETISIYNNLGIVARRSGQSNIAIDYYERGISLARRTPGVETQLGNLLNNLGNLNLDLEKHEESIEQLMEALQIRINNDNRSAITRSYLSLARYYQLQNSDDKALGHLYMALDLAKRIGAIGSMAEAQKLIFEFYQEKQLADSALKYHILYTDLSEKLNKDAALKKIEHLEVISHFKENEILMQIEQ